MEALPVAALLCDANSRVRNLNRVARETFHVEEDEAVGRRPGEVIHCATASRQKCGEGVICAACHLWQTLDAGRAGKTVTHREVVLPILREEGAATRRVFLCSTGPAPPNDAATTVIVLQDITALQRLPGFIAICAQCKLVRHQGEWLTLDNFVGAHTHALFTHTLCPACTATYYRELGGESPPPTGGPTGEG